MTEQHKEYELIYPGGTLSTRPDPRRPADVWWSIQEQQADPRSDAERSFANLFRSIQPRDPDLAINKLSIQLESLLVLEKRQLEAIYVLCMALVERSMGDQIISHLQQASQILEQLANVLELETGEWIAPVSATAETVEDPVEDPIEDPLAILSEREREVLYAMIEGKSTKMIAEQIDVAETTVRTYRARAMEKLNLHNLTELTKFALYYNLTTSKLTQ